MSNLVGFYTISLINDEGKSNFSAVKGILKSIESLLDKKSIFLQRVIGKNTLRCFKYKRLPYTDKIIVIPFGKIKNKNKPYKNNNNNLEEIPEDLYQVSTIAINFDYRMMIITINREGPNYMNIQDYLNSFIPKDKGYKIEIEPIYQNTGYEKIKKAQMVRSVNLTLDLSKNLLNFYNENGNLSGSSLAETLKDVSCQTKETLGSKTLNLNFGIGHGKADGTLRLESVLDLLSRININGDFVKEITVKYKNNKEDKIALARLKESSIELREKLQIKDNIGPEYLLNNCMDVFDSKRKLCYDTIRAKFSNRFIAYWEQKDIVKEWDPKLYYEK